MQNRVWVSEWVVTSSQESQNPSIVQVTFFSVVVRSFPQQKTNKLKLVKQCGHQTSKTKTKGFEIFLKWPHSSPIFHYAVNFIARGQSMKFKAWFYDKRHQNSEFTFWGLRTFLDVTEIPKPKKHFWPYGHLKSSKHWPVCRVRQNSMRSHTCRAIFHPIFF